jgi:hypothetical protein
MFKFLKEKEPEYEFVCKKHKSSATTFWWQKQDVRICSDCVFELLIKSGIKPMEKKVKNG